MKVATLLEDNLQGVQISLKALDAVADAYEIRFDAFLERPDPADIRRLTAKPLIATCRRPVDGGKFQGEEKERLAILERAAKARFDYVDLEEGVELPIHEDQVIRSHHDLRGTPTVSDLVARGRRLSSGRGSHVKLACKVTSADDSLHLIEAMKAMQAESVLASFMGMGDFPRAVAHLAGSELTYGGGRRLQTGQPALRDIQHTLHAWGDPQPARDLYVVVGRPVSHSRSPALHNAAFRSLKMDAAFGAIELQTEGELGHLIGAAPRLGIKGLSVTSPFKEAAWARVKRATPEARRAKSVNCIRFEGGEAVGHNTDGLGAERVLDRLLGPQPKPPRIVVLGTGGAARGLLSQVKKVEVVVAGRDRHKLQAIENEFGVGTVRLESTHSYFPSYACIVNATAVEDPMRLDGFRGSVFDLHYGDHVMAWERAAKTLGLKYVGGRELLLEQALPAFEFWTGRTPPREAMAAALGGPAS
jgi:shikimate dehydrogenase/3-dehydroquinate dehydratase type I